MFSPRTDRKAIRTLAVTAGCLALGACGGTSSSAPAPVTVTATSTVAPTSPRPSATPPTQPSASSSAAAAPAAGEGQETITENSTVAAPGTYTLPSGLSVTYGQPVPYESEYAYIYEKDFGETPLFFKVPVSVTNDSSTLVDGGFFTHVMDIEAGKRCDLSMFDTEAIVRIQPGATAEGAMTVTCPASTVGKPFTIGAYFNPDGVGSMEGNHFKYTLTGTVPG